MISVVIPFFRSGPYLGEAIESVLNQTEKNWELVLVDNNASEDTREFAEKYAGKFPGKMRIVHEPRQGLPFARNLGIQESHGEYIALLDDDDLMYPDRLVLQKKALVENPKAVLAYGLMDIVSVDNTSMINPAQRDKKSFFHFQDCPTEVLIKTRLDFPDIRPSTAFFVRKVALEAGLFDEHFSPFFLEDTDFNLRLYRLGDFLEVSRPIIRLRSPSSEFLKRKRKNAIFLYRQLNNQDYFYSKVCKLLEEEGLLDHPEVRKFLRKWRGRWLKEASFAFLGYENGTPFARWLLFRSIQENPRDLTAMKHMMRSFLSAQKRAEKYGDRHLSDKCVPEEITTRFLEGLFSGTHHCPFCVADET